MKNLGDVYRLKDGFAKPHRYLDAEIKDPKVIQINAFVNANHAGNKVTHRPHIGFLIYLFILIKRQLCGIQKPNLLSKRPLLVLSL
jgi:hypothetical protein